MSEAKQGGWGRIDNAKASRTRSRWLRHLEPMCAMNGQPDLELTDFVEALARDVNAPDASVCLIVERLRRLEEEARLGDGDRQTLQKLASARRILGDRLDLGQTASPATRALSRGAGR